MITAIENLTSDSVDCKNQTEFFNLFPNDSNNFYKYFLNNPNIERRKQFTFSEKVVERYFQLSCIDDSLFFSRTIKLFIQLDEWNSHAMFQYHLYHKINENFLIFIKTLKRFDIKSQATFWNYYFDNQHPDDVFSEKFEHLKKTDPDIYKIIFNEFNKNLEKYSH
ncbi:MAG: hypothetical protein WC121_08745 [Candidatus Kapaibacterium sp.]